MKKTIFIICVMLPAIVFSAHVKNSDKPLKGEWDFKLQKVWDIENAGAEVLGRPHGILAAADGTLILCDRKQNIDHLFDKDGRYLKSFAKRGEGPGEVKIQTFFFLVNEKVVIPDVNKIHYFSKSGELIESLPVKKRLIPDVFLNEKEIIISTKSIFDIQGDKGKIHKMNVVNGEEKLLAEFRVFKGGGGDSDGNVYEMIVMGLTPLMTIGYGSERLYYGMSDRYHIEIMDLKGKKTGSFSLDRDKRKITKARKRAHFRSRNLPPEALNKIVKSLPDNLTYFQDIEVHDGLVYVFTADLGRSREKQEIDIFTREGKYLYKSCLRFGKGNSMLFSPFGNLRIVKDHLYVVLENDSGDVLVRNYRISLPKPRGAGGH